MSLICALAVALLGAETATTASVVVPWAEFKTLCGDKLLLSIPEKKPLVYALEEAQYALDAGLGNARGEVVVTGKVIEGDPEPIALCGPEIVITTLNEVTGGAVLPLTAQGGSAFLPEKGAGPFQIRAEFVIRPVEEGRVRIIAFNAPQALRNSLELKIPAGFHVLECPGIPDAAGIHRFSPVPRLTVKYTEAALKPAEVIKDLKAVDMPAVVLDAQYLFTSLEENGNILSVLVMDVPAEHGTQLELQPVPDSQVWSLTVNQVRKRVYIGERGSWIIPLDSGKSSRVELGFLRKGQKIGLEGKMDIDVPATGLASQELRVAFALPPRVEVLFMDGPVNAAPGENWERPEAFLGKPYYFSQAFYKGEGLKLSVSYKEPLNDQRPQGDAK